MSFSNKNTVAKENGLYSLHRKQRAAACQLGICPQSECFPGIRFSHEVDTLPLNLQRASLFANQVARFESEMNPADVSSFLKSIEREAGSTRQERAGEIIRLDVDLLSCDGQVYKPQDWGRTYVKQGIEELDKI